MTFDKHNSEVRKTLNYSPVVTSIILYIITIVTMVTVALFAIAQKHDMLLLHKPCDNISGGKFKSDMLLRLAVQQ